MTILATWHRDGRTLAAGQTTYVLAVAGNYAVQVTISEHRITERVLEWNLRTTPICDPGTPTNVMITNNVVGCTLIGVGAGTTLTVEAVASGF